LKAEILKKAIKQLEIDPEKLNPLRD